MRTLRYVILAALAVLLFTLAIANREIVVVRFLPRGLAEAMGGSWAVQMPLFLVILGAAAIGLLLGFIWEWLREHRLRADARRVRNDVTRLEAEVSALRQDTVVPGRLGRPGRPGRPGRQDDVLALLETGGKSH